MKDVYHVQNIHIHNHLTFDKIDQAVLTAVWLISYRCFCKWEQVTKGRKWKEQTNLAIAAHNFREERKIEFKNALQEMKYDTPITLYGIKLWKTQEDEEG